VGEGKNEVRKKKAPRQMLDNACEAAGAGFMKSGCAGRKEGFSKTFKARYN